MNAKECNHQYNETFNKMNAVYHNIAKQFHMSDTQFWILYALTEENKPLTQCELMNYLIAPKQTIHSAIHKLINENYISLQQTQGNRKLYDLTKEGKRLANQTVKKVIQDEINIFNEFTDEERTKFLIYTQKYISLLEKRSYDDTTI